MLTAKTPISVRQDIYPAKPAKPTKPTKPAKKPETIILYGYAKSDLASAIAGLAELQRDVATLQSDADEKIHAIQEELDKTLAPLIKEIQKIALSIKNCVDKNRTELFPLDCKTLKLSTGDLSYRRGKPSVDAKSTKDLIADILEQNELTTANTNFSAKMEKVFLTYKLELDKTAILKSPDEAFEVTGVGIKEGGEGFYIKPYQTDTEIMV